MTSRERFLAVLRGEMPDRVPVTLFIQDQGHFLGVDVVALAGVELAPTRHPVFVPPHRLLAGQLVQVSVSLVHHRTPLSFNSEYNLSNASLANPS